MERLYIAGEYVETSGGQPTPVINPATEAVLAEVPDASSADIDRLAHLAV